MTAANANPFVLAPTEYARDINILNHYVEDATNYLVTMTGKSVSQCREYVKKNLGPGGRFEFKDPKVKYLERVDGADRFKRLTTLSEYIGKSVNEREIISPNFTTYINPEKKQSLLVDFIDGNVAARGRAKKAMFAARMAKDTDKEALSESEQRTKKLSNNAISGSHLSASTPLVNKTAHSTLTSICRSTSGYGNANNEKFLSGNRHYRNAEILLNNLVSIVNRTDYDKQRHAMDMFGIRHPTVAETMECIRYSTGLYGLPEYSLQTSIAYVNKLTPEQRSAFVYTGDLYHLAKFNDKVVRRFINRLCSKVQSPCIDPKSELKKYREEYRTLAFQFYPSELRGISFKDLQENPVVNGKPMLEYLASTVRNIHDTLTEYADLIDAFWVTTNLPASLAYFPESIRRAALTSDTDSTIFTVQDWVFWHRGSNPGFTDETDATAATMIFLAAETITHVLARMSANLGVVTKRIHQIAMKNEYKFPVFVPTQVGKHYFAYVSCQEGNLYEHLETEIKGVHLKNSNVPAVIMDQAEDMMKEIMDTVMANKKISLHGMLQKVANIEHEIIRSVLAGESTYFRFAQIKSPDSYTKSKEESPYQHHILWQEVFAPKYGDAPAPPYAATKISVGLKSNQGMKDWVASIEDREFAKRLEAWIEKYEKNGTQTFLLPTEALARGGMPKELVTALDMRRIVYDLTGVFYVLLETLGYYASNDRTTRLVSDEYPSTLTKAKT